MKILHVEDSAEDTELVRLALRRAGPFEVERVEDEAAYRDALAREPPDAILCDYDLPQFSAERALEILRQCRLDIPFIVVSNHIGEGAAVEAMQQGADDYLAKRDLGRLPKAIESSMGRARERAARSRAQDQLAESEAIRRGILDSLDSRICVLDEHGSIIAVNRAWEEFERSRNALGACRAVPGADYFDVLRTKAAGADRLATQGPEAIRSVLERRALFAALDYSCGSGASARWFLARVTPFDGRGRGAVVSHQDITDRILSHAALESAHQRLRAMSGRVLSIQEEERRAISRELHDDIGQNLAALKIGLHRLDCEAPASAAAVREECLRIVDTTIERLRALAQDLRPPQLDQLGLGEALRWLARRQGAATGIEITCETTGVGPGSLPEALENACYRIAQEAVNNATRHAAPKRIDLRVQHGGGLLRLDVRDDGSGFDEPAQRERAVRQGSFGLIGMEERAELAGGRLSVKTIRGRGTTVTAIFPGVEPKEER